MSTGISSFCVTAEQKMATGSSSSVTDEEEDNFFRIYKLVAVVGTDAVRDTFDRFFPPLDLVTTLTTEKKKIQDLEKRKNLNAHQISLLFPASGNTSSKQYDISLMMCLIRNFANLSKPINGFDDFPVPCEITTEADLARIKCYRNQLAHPNSVKISNTNFKIMWKSLAGAMVRLGGKKYQIVCDELQQTKLSKNCIIELRQDIAKVQEEINFNLQQLKKDIEKKTCMIDEILETNTEITTKLEKLEKEKTALVTDMIHIDNTQQNLQETVTENEKRLLETKKEQEYLKSKLDDSNVQNQDICIKIDEINTDHQQMQKRIDEVRLEQHKAAESDKAGREEVKSLKSEMETIKEDNERFIDKVQMMELENEDPVPRNIRKQLKRTMDEWKVELKTFICTRAYDDVLEKISSNSCVIVTGGSGSGKSAIVRHVSLFLRDTNGYDIITVATPMELKNYYNPGRKTLFVLDDVCGKFTANLEQICEWDLMKDVVKQVIEDDSCKLLLSCRLQVYKDPKFLLLQHFSSCECNITSDELCLTIKETNKIANTYLNIVNIKDDILARKNAMFPLLCRLCSIGKNDVGIEKYLDAPYQVYRAELDAFKIHGKLKLCGLCLCTLFNNKMNTDRFMIIRDDFRTIVKDTCEYIGLENGTSVILIRDELDTLAMDKTYINKHNGLYEIFHDKLFDFFAFYFGQMMPKCFIDHADSEFLRERFLWKNAADTDECSIENMILLDDCLLEYYIDRMIFDWKTGKVSDVFYNRNMKYSSFRKEFLKRLNLLKKEKVALLSNVRDSFRKDFASGNTPLIICCLDGYVDLMKWLLDHDANVNDYRKDGTSALYMACQKNYVEAVQILLEKNADVNSCTDEGVSPLGIACYSYCNLQIINALLEKKAEVNKFKYKVNNMTPLFMACQTNHYFAVEELLKHGADPNVCLHDGMSVLLYACQNQHTEIVHLLIQYKANPNAKMRDGDTPLLSSSLMGLVDITEILLDNGADCGQCLQSKEVIEKSLESLSQSLENEKQTWYDCVKDYGSEMTTAYISTKSHDYVFDVFAGASPLHMACFMGHTKICKLLTEKLSTVDIRKEDGTTPLFYASELGHLAIVRVLLDKKANPTICRNNQSSPLTIAERNGHASVLSLINSYLIT